MDKEKVIFFWKRWWLLIILIATLLIRLPWFLTATIPFNFDHGKDSLAVMHMVLTYSPKFIGPWTSIPGLYFGPAWYYWLAPWYLVGGFNPVWGAVAMWATSILVIWLVKKEFGWLPALIVGTAPTWLTISFSAWNPFPMPLISLLMLIGIEHLRQTSVLEVNGKHWRWWALIGLAAGLGFHFSTAYAVFFPIIIIASLVFYQIRSTFSQLVVLIACFVLMFVPQIFFEVKNNFLETRGVIRYITTGDGQAKSTDTLIAVAIKTLDELKLGVLPDVWMNNSMATAVIAAISTVLLLLAIFWSVYKHKEWGRWWFEVVIWIGLPVVGFTILHYNIWYVLGMLPVAVLFVADKIQRLPKFLITLFVVLSLLTPITKIWRFVAEDQVRLSQSRQLLPIKLETIKKIRELAGNRPFSVYHYVPDIYDFTYQYLYFYQAYQGKMLPVEFNYQPNSPTYISEKAELLQFFSKRVDNRQPEVVFYVVEKPDNQNFLKSWWGMQRFSKIESEYQLSDEVTIYTATP